MSRKSNSAVEIQNIPTKRELTPKQVAALKRGRAALEQKAREKEKEDAKELRELRKKRGANVGKEEKEDRFLHDMKWVYQKYGGKAQLLKLIKLDPDLRKTFFKELLKSETKEREIDAKRKMKENDGNRRKNFVFVLTGLETPKDRKQIASQKGIDHSSFDNILSLVPESNDDELELTGEEEEDDE